MQDNPYRNLTQSCFVRDPVAQTSILIPLLTLPILNIRSTDVIQQLFVTRSLWCIVWDV
jgi:hypothetical protein